MRRGGFTLIEMLVVLAVTTVLLGIMLPALLKVRYRSRFTLCMSNQREIVGGVNFYAVDNDNRYPPSVASIGKKKSWNWGDPRKMTALFNTTQHERRAMSEYISEYIRDSSIMFCPNGPEKYSYLQEAWVAGDDWDNPDTLLLEDAMSGTYCFWWSYTGLLEDGLFKGPRNMLGGRGESELVVSDYFGFANWRNEMCFGGDYYAYGSCEPFKGAEVTPGEPSYPPGSAFWSGLRADGFNLETIKVKLNAGFADGHVESYTAEDVTTLKVIKNRFRLEVYEYDDHGPGYFYIPISGSH